LEDLEKNLPNNGGAPSTLHEADGDIRFDSVSFRYAGQKTPILRNVSMLLEKEKIHALVGESGCGKSSTLKLMAGLVTHQSGTLRLNTSKVHYMPQASSSTMFARSLRENLTYGLSQDLDRSSEESTIWEALRSVDLASFVQGLPEGLDSIVDESSLSGGEKQRFQLARLLCNQDAELVLIDEGLSELDGRRRKKIIQVLQDALRGKTGVVVTHHDNILTICDKIHDLSSPQSRCGDGSVNFWSRPGQATFLME